MTPSPHNHDRLERSMHQVLRELPPRRAPRSLEERVLAEIARRAALPWWRKSFSHWPIAVRAGFVVGTAGVLKAAHMAVVWAIAGFDLTPVRDALAAPMAWLRGGAAVIHAAAEFCEVLFRAIPPLWLYGSLAIVASLYVALFGLGAAAYRTLYADR